MIYFIISVLVFSVTYTIKGGGLKYFVKNLDNIRNSKILYDVILDGKVLSCIIVVFYMMFMIGDVSQSLLFTIAWLLAVAPSVGEEHGAIGDLHGVLPAYKKTDRGVMYDIKKGTQRGVWMGALMTLCTTEISYIVCSLFFVPVVFLGQELTRRVSKERGWKLAEPLVGAVVFGIPTGLFIMGVH